MLINSISTLFSWGLVLSMGAILINGSGYSPAVRAAPTAPELKIVRTLETNDVFGEAFFRAGKPDLSGVGFPPGAHTLLLLNRPAGHAGLALTSPPKNGNGEMARTLLEIYDPINIAFDSVSRGAKGYGSARLFILDAKPGELITIPAGPRDTMEPAKIKRFDARGFGIVNPQGMTVDPATGRLFVLEQGAGSPHLVIIQPKPGHQFAQAETSQIALPSEMGNLRGIAFNPADGHLYLLSTEQQKLYKVNPEGKPVAYLGISGPQIGAAQGFVFAPSLDLTDQPSIFHLYLVTERRPAGETTEWALPETF
ncbi:MAG: hypothetical protein ACXWT4_20170 [Methylobacter sp.]